jgi:hypothetical protein
MALQPPKPGAHAREKASLNLAEILPFLLGTIVKSIAANWRRLLPDAARYQNLIIGQFRLAQISTIPRTALTKPMARRIWPGISAASRMARRMASGKAAKHKPSTASTRAIAVTNSLNDAPAPAITLFYRFIVACLFVKNREHFFTACFLVYRMLVREKPRTLFHSMLYYLAPPKGSLK